LSYQIVNSVSITAFAIPLDEKQYDDIDSSLKVVEIDVGVDVVIG